MRNSIWNKRIPSLLGIAMLLIGVGITSYLLQFKTLFTSKAAPGNTPQEVRITNITENSFTVSFKTTDTVNGSISYGTDATYGKIALDDRDKQSGIPAPYTLHYITLTGLRENQKYVFSIISGANTYLQDVNPYTVTTASKIITEPSSQLPLAGSIVTSTGAPAKGTILYVTTAGSQVLSSLTKDDGSYLIPLNAVRKADLTEYIPLSQTSVLKVLAFNMTELSHLSVLAKQTNPVPLITLSKDYDFTSDAGNQSNTTNVASASASEKTDFPSFSSTEVGTKNPGIVTPKKKEAFNDAQPTFTGTGSPNQTVTIEIHSTDIVKDSIKTDAKGNWKYRPKQALTPGDHTISITTKDVKGVLKTITQSFVVYAEGSQSTQPSVSPVQPTAKPTATPTSVPTAIPSPTPTAIVLSPTMVPTTIPTVILPTPTIILPTSTLIPTVVRAVSPLPATGSSSGVVIAIFGVVVVGVGMLLFVLTQKNL